MNRRTNLGLIVILVGLLAFVVPRIPFEATREPLDPGPVVTEADVRGPGPFDVVAGVVLAGGIVLVILGLSRKG